MKKKIISVAICTCVCAVALTAGVALVSAENRPGWSDSDIQSEYMYNTVFSVQDRTYTRGGETYPASAVVCYPDGTRSASSEIVLNQAGTYTVKYTVKAGDKYYADSETFLVNYPTCYVLNQKSSVSYGVPENANTEGVIASLAVNDSLTFTQLIDFTNVTSDRMLVKGYVVPNVAGTADANELIFTFTDSVDDSIYFQVHHYAYDWCANTYVAANGNNQEPTGEQLSNGKLVIQKGNGFGQWCCVSMKSVQKKNGVDTVTPPDEQQFFVAMDYAERKLYAPGYVGTTGMYCDLDDSKYFDEFWSGFPSGKARLSISCSGYQSATATVCVTSVLGIDDLGDGVYLDGVAPEITVNDDYSGDFPYAEAGYSYEIPSASAYDEYAGKCDVTTEVWYNYGLPGQVNVLIEDGKFNVSKAGTYAIVYKACDRIGNTAQVVKYITAYETTETARLNIPTEKTTRADIGTWVTIPQLTSDDVIGGSGRKTIKTYIEIDGQREEVTSGGFRAVKLGTYKVIYEACDYVGKTATASYDVTVEIGASQTTPVPEEGIDFYPLYISGITYRLPEYYAYRYDGTLKRELCDIVVTDANGTVAHRSGSDVKLKVNENYDSIKFEIKSNGVTVGTHYAVGVLAWVNDRLTAENYFYGTGFTKEKVSENRDENITSGLLMTATAGTEKFSFTFANPLLSDYLPFTIASITGNKSNSSVVITVTDSEDSHNSVSAVLDKDGANYRLSTGGKSATIQGTTFGDAVSVTFAKGEFTIGNTSLKASGFENFSSRKVFLTVSYENIEEGSSIKISEIGNTKINTLATDRYAPIIASENENGGTYKSGDEYTLIAPYAYDVYSPDIAFTLTVKDPDGNIVTSKDGTILNDAVPDENYVISLEKIGQYVITYTASETEEFISRTNKASFGYSVNVSDTVKPEIEWKGEFVKTANINDTVVVPAYVVTDNYTASENMIVRIFVETPDNRLMMLPGNSVVVTQSGTYVFRIMVADEAGNMINETFEVVVNANE